MGRYLDGVRHNIKEKGLSAKQVYMTMLRIWIRNRTSTSHKSGNRMKRKKNSILTSNYYYCTL